ncbi:MAG: succinylglutamate desuccinylase/aspartoacylase family protein, partial [Planctomycetota bacterium]
RAGTLVMVPVLNILGFERHSRYLPDRRDLNRCFPGIADGSMASRMAGRIFQKLVRPCDYVIDLHTAAVRRTNYPNLRADLQNPDCDALARVFGAGIILDGRGPKGSLRRSATDRGIPTVIVEGGEVWKMEPAVVGCMSRGILNVLRHLKMVDGQPDVPTRQTVINHTKWVRAERGGLIQLHVAPGDSVEQGQPIATNCDLLNNEQNVLVSPWNGVVIGISTLPAVQPGEPIVHVGRFDSQRKKRQFERRVQKDEIQRIAHDHLSTSVMVTIHDDTETDVPAADGNGSER